MAITEKKNPFYAFLNNEKFSGYFYLNVDENNIICVWKYNIFQKGFYKGCSKLSSYYGGKKIHYVNPRSSQAIKSICMIYAKYRSHGLASIALHKAIKDKNILMVIILLKNPSTNINSFDLNCHTPIYLACKQLLESNEKPDFEIINLLLDQPNIKINIQGENNNTLLHLLFINYKNHPLYEEILNLPIHKSREF